MFTYYWTTLYSTRRQELVPLWKIQLSPVWFMVPLRVIRGLMDSVGFKYIKLHRAHDGVVWVCDRWLREVMRAVVFLGPAVSKLENTP